VTLSRVVTSGSVETRRCSALQTDGDGSERQYVAAMRYELPVIWTTNGATHAGRLELVGDQMKLISKGETISFGAASVTAFAIERAPEQRLRCLPVLSMTLEDGDVLRVASMGGAGSLLELASRLGARQLAATGT